MTRYRIAEQWNSFAQATLPPDCSPLQRQEMRRDFYAGVRMMLSAVLRDLTPGSEAEEPDVQMLSDMEAELQKFASDVRVGAA